jgi:uncharacterized membrane-anchored protein YitT (DUF2179 family)
MTMHGATIIYGRGSYEDESTKSVVYSVVTATQVSKVVNTRCAENSIKAISSTTTSLNTVVEGM